MMTQSTPETISDTPAPARPRNGEFVAINSIACTDAYRERFETLFKSRAHAIDKLPGFHNMVVLKPSSGTGDYLVVSYWDDRASFENWHKSSAFAEGHRRGFDDVRQARERGEQPPMTSHMELYDILCD